MKVYPLIYSRTKFCDYVSGFLVRPQNFDSLTASKYVSVALNEVKHTGGIRHAVFSVGEYIIYGGTACVTTSLVARILKEKNMINLDFDYQEFQSDKADRPITFFIGFAVKRSEIKGEELPNIDLYGTYKIYLNYLKRQWLSESTKTEVVLEDDYIELDVIKDKPVFIPDVFEKQGLCIVKNYSEENYQKVINYYFKQIVRNPTVNSSFLSNILPDMLGENIIFKNISIYGVNADEYIKSYSRTDINKNSAYKNADNVKLDTSLESSPRIYHSTSDFSNDTAKPSPMSNSKNNRIDGPTVYHSSAQYAQEHGDSERKKSIPTSGKIIIAILIALLVGGLIIAASRDHTKAQAVKMTQSQGKTNQNQYLNRQEDKTKLDTAHCLQKGEF